MNKYDPTFFKNIVTVAGGAGVSQILPIFSQILLVRMLAPESFGQFAGWMAIVSIISVVMTLRLEHSFAIEKNQSIRLEVMFGVRLTSIFVGTSAVLLYFCLRYVLGSSILFDPMMFFYAVLSAFFMADNKVMLAFLSAGSEFKSLNGQRFTFALATNTGMLIFCYSNPEPESLYLGYSLGGLTCLLLAYRKTKFALGFLSINKYPLLKMWRRRKEYIMYSLPADTVNAVSGQLPVLLVIALYGDAMGGYVALAIRMVGAPLGLVSLAILDVFKGDWVRVGAEVGAKGYSNIYYRTLSLLTMISFLYIILSYAIGSFTFEAFFGKDWAMAGAIAVSMTPLFASRFIASPLSYMVYLTKNQKIDFIWQLTMILVVYFSLTLPTSFDAALVAYVLGVSSMYVLYLLLSYLMAIKGLRV